ncbi:MAG: apolipoprotein N-acyltransferase [Candidatus Omnitrophica bacterium]|nr:apolipoprotein N-acyltransferase [Candidatus Omnitrophota bacterium]
MLLCLLSVFVFYLSFPNQFYLFGFWPCIWVFAVPLLFALQGQPLKIRLKIGLFFGLGAYGLMAQGVYPISPTVFFIFVLGMSTQAWMFAIFCRSTGKILIDIFYYPLLWSLSEVLRNLLLGGFSFYISHSHAFCPQMLKLYSTWGCSGMSGIIFMVNTLIYLGGVHRRRRVYFFFAAGIIFLTVCSAGLLKKDMRMQASTRLRVAVIQANISPWEKIDADLFDRNANIHLRLTEQSFREANPDLVIWPETAFPDDLLQSVQWRPIIAQEAIHRGTDLLIGIAPNIDGKDYNSAVLIGSDGKIRGLYHKQALVPFFEYAPLAAWGIGDGRGYYFSAGKKTVVMSLSRKSVRLGVLICTESAHPFMAYQLRRRGAQILVEMSNDGWFRTTPAYMLHAQAAVMRAVENRIWVIRAANTGYSFVVDPDGNIHEDGNLKLGREGFGIFDIMVP